MQFTYEEALKEVMLFVDSNTTTENSYKMSCAMAALIRGDKDEQYDKGYADGYKTGRCQPDSVDY